MPKFIQRIVETLDEQADWNVTTTVSRKDLLELVAAYHNLREQQQIKNSSKPKDSEYHETFTEVGLAIAENLANHINTRGGEARIAKTWFDYGQKWSWETIICKNQSMDMDFQLLSPRDFKEMNEGTFNRYDKVFERAGVSEVSKQKKQMNYDYEH